MSPTPLAPRFGVADRVAFALIAGMAGFLGLVALVDGTWRTVALAVGDGHIELLAEAPITGNTGEFSAAIVRSDALDDTSRALLATGSGIAALVATVIGIAVVTFLVMTARGTPFHRLLYPVVLTTGLVMSLGGMIASGLEGFGRMIAGGELGDPYYSGFEVNIGPWAFGFVVLAAAYVIRAGQRLQRETEGLV